MGLIGIVVGAVAGCCFGVVVTSLAIAARRADEKVLLFEPEKKSMSGQTISKSNGRTIRFTDPSGDLMFTIPDGDFIDLMYGNGERVAGHCRYLDQNHAEIDGVEWKMTEFALQMQIRGIRFSPLLIE